MRTGLDVLQNTEWDRTFHAHGPADDVPGHLAALLGGDAERSRGALGRLHSTLVHRGTVYPAAVPAALFVAGTLDRPALDALVPDPDPEEAGAGPEPLRAGLLGLLADVVTGTLTGTPTGALTGETDGELAGGARLPEAEGARTTAAIRSDGKGEPARVREEPATEALMRQVAVDMRAAAPVLRDAVRPYLTHADPLVRIRAVEAASAVARTGAPELDLSGAADMAESREEGAVIVLALGENGRDVSEFLTHADPAIRACAALAPGRWGDPAAADELRSALADPDTTDAWFTGRLRRFPGKVSTELATVLAKGPRVLG